MKGALSIRSALVGIAMAGGCAFPSAAFGQSDQSTTLAPSSATASAVPTNQTYVDVTGSLGYSSNPFLNPDGDGSFFGRLSASGVHSFATERSSGSLTAFVENSTYVGGRGSQQIFDLAAHGRYRVSEVMEIFGDAGFSGDFGGQLFSRFNDVPSAPPVTVPGGVETLPEQFFDNSVLFLNRRQYRLFGQVGAAFKMSERDSLSVSGGGQYIFFSSDGDELNYTVANANVAWQHRLTDRTTVGARGSVQRANYAGPDNSATVFSPQVTLSTRFAEGWDANLAAGASFVNRRTPFGNDHSIGPSIDASICRTTESERYCARASHSVQTAAGQDPQNTSSAGGDFFKRINVRDTLQARAAVVRYSGIDNNLGSSSRAAYYTVGVSASRKLTPRLSFGGDVGVRKYVQRASERVPADYSASAFVRYRFGDVK